MPGRQAKVISAPTLRRMLLYVKRTSAQPERDRVIVLLSVKAGLRACEIAGLDWSMVLDDKGRVGPVLSVRDAIAKNGSGRQLPIHPDLRLALQEVKAPGVLYGPVIISRRGGALRPNSVVNFFVSLYHALGLVGCSSHSGRRSFITQAARNLHRAGCSLRDVQVLAGHRSIETTQRYIDGDTDAQRKLVALL